MAKVLSRLDIVLFANTAQYRREMSNTQSDTKKMFAAMKDDAIQLGKVGAAAFAGMAAAGAAAVGVMIQEQIQFASEINATARIANTGVESMQKLAIAAKSVGVEQDTLGDIYKDTQDKIGDFLTTGGGAMADFFDSLPPSVDLTAEAFRNLSGPDALQLYYDTLQDANLSQSEMVFYMEGIASDASLLIPLLHDGGAGFDLWAQAAENAGAVMDEETIRATQELTVANELMMLSYDGAKKQFTQALMPVLSDVAGQLVGTADAADTARLAGEKLAQGFKVVAATGLGVITIVRAIGKAIGGMAAVMAQWGTVTDGVDFTSPFAFFQIAKNVAWDIPVQQLKVYGDVISDIKNDFVEANKTIEDIYALGTNGTNPTVKTLTDQKILRNEILGIQGQTGQQIQANAKAEEEAAKAAQKAADAAAKEKAKEAKAVKDLGAAYVSNTALSNLKIKSSEAMAGGKVRGYTAEFAQVTQSLIGENLRYFSSFNDAYHKNKGGQHPAGQAFDVVLKDARQAKKAAAEIEAAAKQYGYSVKILNEYANPSKNATGGHLHVSVYGQKDMGANGADLQYIKQQQAEVERAAAEQLRFEQQQAQKRAAIQMEYADEVTRIETQRDNKIKEIQESGFTAEDQTRYIEEAKKRAEVDIREYTQAQDRKLEALSDFTKSEEALILQNAQYRIQAIENDITLTAEGKAYAMGLIREQTQYQIDQYQLAHDWEMQYAQAYGQTTAERIRNQYALERREIMLTINMDEQLRKAKIESIKAAEELALEDLRLSHQRELRALITDDKSELKALRESYREQREALDRRTDIDDGQKSELRNKMSGAEQFAVGQYGMGVGAQVDSLQAELGGRSEQKALTDQRAARLELIKQADELEILQGQALYDAKLAVEKDYQRQSQMLMLSNAEQQFGATTELMKMAFGEQHTLYKAAFLAQKAMAIGQALINIPESYSKAFNAVVGIPIVGPGLAPIAGAAAAALQVAQKVMISKVQPPSTPGFYSGGYTGDIPTTSVAGSVHGQEFVANAKVTKQYRPELEAMHKGTYDKKASGNVVNIHNYTGAKVTQRKDSNGDLEILIGEELSKQLPNIVNDPSSKFNKALRDQYHLQRSL